MSAAMRVRPHAPSWAWPTRVRLKAVERRGCLMQPDVYELIYEAVRPSDADVISTHLRRPVQCCSPIHA